MAAGDDHIPNQAVCSSTAGAVLEENIGGNVPLPNRGAKAQKASSGVERPWYTAYCCCNQNIWGDMKQGSDIEGNCPCPNVNKTAPAKWARRDQTMADIIQPVVLGFS